jgi:hypothetical protein
MLQLIENTITWKNLIANSPNVPFSYPFDAFGLKWCPRLARAR